MKDSEEDFKGFLVELVNEGRISNPKDIELINEVVNNNFSALSDQQISDMEDIIDPHVYLECSECNSIITWNDMAKAGENGGICQTCERINIQCILSEHEDFLIILKEEYILETEDEDCVVNMILEKREGFLSEKQIAVFDEIIAKYEFLECFRCGAHMVCRTIDKDYYPHFCDFCKDWFDRQ